MCKCSLSAAAGRLQVTCHLPSSLCQSDCTLLQWDCFPFQALGPKIWSLAACAIFAAAAAAAKSLQLCPTLCDLIGSSPSGSSVHGIFQARTLEWLPLPSPVLSLAMEILQKLQICNPGLQSISHYQGCRHPFSHIISVLRSLRVIFDCCYQLTSNRIILSSQKIAQLLSIYQKIVRNRRIGEVVHFMMILLSSHQVMSNSFVTPWTI